MREKNPPGLDTGAVSASIRQSGDCSLVPLCLPEPRCCMAAHQLDAEFKAAVARNDPNNIAVGTPPAFLAVIERDRTCPTFVEWVPAFTPKEHVEMLWEERHREREKADAARHASDKAERDARWRQEDADKKEKEAEFKERESNDRWVQWGGTIFFAICSLTAAVCALRLSYQREPQPLLIPAPIVNVPPETGGFAVRRLRPAGSARTRFRCPTRAALG